MPTELSKTQELQMRAEQGDATAAVVPTERLRVEFPFIDSENRIKPVPSSTELIYFIPSGSLWSASAKGFGQYKGNQIPNSTRCYESMMGHIAFTAHTLGEGKDNDVQKQFVTWTNVPSHKDPEESAGFLIRVLYHVPQETVLELVSNHVNTCDKMNQASVKHGKDHGQTLPMYLRCTSDVYVHMCNYYNGRDVGDRADGFQDLDKLSNPFNPFNVFRLEVAMQKMANAGASADFRDIQNYRDAEGRVLFPMNGAFTYLLPPAQLNPLYLRKLYLPHVTREVKKDNAEFRAYAQNAGMPVNAAGELLLPDGDSDIGDDIDSENGDMRGGRSSDQAMHALVDQYTQLALSTDGEASNTLQAFKKRVGMRMGEAKRAAGGDETVFLSIERPKAQLECIRWLWKEIITQDETTDCGDSLKAIAAWRDNFLTTHINFMMPTPKFSTNLSRFADMQAADLATCESTFAINTAHQEVKSLRLASMHSYFYSPFHCHTNLIGPPGSGKSNTFQHNDRRLIKGTSRDIGAESAKAKMTPGKKTDLAIETFEDISPGHIGISGFGKGGAAATSNTEQESLLKYRLTKGRVKGIYKQVINGVHSMVEVDSFCNTVMLIGTNALLHDIPKSIADRFNNISFQHRERENLFVKNPSMFNKQGLSADRSLEPNRVSLKLRDERNQLFHCVIQLCCFSGVFDMPDLTVPVLIWSRTLDKAKRAGLHDTSNVRHFERLKMHCETLVVEDAIDRVLDSELTPLDIKKPFQVEDILHFEKHLYGNTEHASMTLGMFQHAYEHTTTVEVERFLRDVLLKTKIANGEIGKVDVNPAISSEMSYYYVMRFEHLPTNTSFDRERTMQHSEQLRRFAIYLLSRMPIKSSVDQIQYVLDNISKLQLEVANTDRPEEKITIPALQFSRDGEVMIAVHLMKNFKRDRLKSCLREVLCHEYTHPKNILYGRSKDSCPYVWQTMKIVPNQGNTLIMERPSFFSAPVLKLTRGAVMGVSAAALTVDWNEVQPTDLGADAFKSLFSDTSHKNVDMDLDLWVARHHAHKIGLEYFTHVVRSTADGERITVPAPDVINGNTYVANFTRASIAAVVDPSEMDQYPICFTEMETELFKADIKKDQAQHPEKYSLKSSLKKRKKPEHDPDAAEIHYPDELKHDAEMEDVEPEAEDVIPSDVHFCSDGDLSDDDGGGENEDECDFERYVPPPSVARRGAASVAPAFNRNGAAAASASAAYGRGGGGGGSFSVGANPKRPRNGDSEGIFMEAVGRQREFPARRSYDPDEAAPAGYAYQPLLSSSFSPLQPDVYGSVPLTQTRVLPC